MKFKFSLQKVLEHRKIKEELAQKDFQEALVNFNEAKDRLRVMLETKTSAHEQAGQLAVKGGPQGPALRQIDEFLKGQEVLIQRQKQKIQEMEKLVESKREILRQAAQEYKIMEKMRENKFAEYKAERLLTEQKEMDEQSILRFKAVKES
ncbi:MAG: flagellar export protein FliJ [Pseudobdellovibrionaceae bacterium]